MGAQACQACSWVSTHGERQQHFGINVAVVVMTSPAHREGPLACQQCPGAQNTAVGVDMTAAFPSRKFRAEADTSIALVSLSGFCSIHRGHANVNGVRTS